MTTQSDPAAVIMHQTIGDLKNLNLNDLGISITLLGSFVAVQIEKKGGGFRLAAVHFANQNFSKRPIADP